MAKSAQFLFDIGDEVKDVISGFQGYVIGRFEFMTGCNHYGVEQKAQKDGKLPYESIDEQRLELVKAAAVSLARRYDEKAAPLAAVRTSPGRTPSRNPQRRAT